MRQPLARLVRFERAALQAFNRPLAKLERLHEGSGFDEYEPSDHRELVAHLLDLAEKLEADERQLTAKVERLAKAKRTNQPLAPIESRIAARRNKAAEAKEAAAAKQTKAAAYTERLRTTVEPMLATEPQPPAARTMLQAMRSDPGANSAGNRAALRSWGFGQWADDLLRLVKEQ